MSKFKYAANFNMNKWVAADIYILEKGRETRKTKTRKT